MQQRKEDDKPEEVVPVKKKGWGRALKQMTKFRVCEFALLFHALVYLGKHVRACLRVCC
jgi:hypothetical protein